MNMHLTRVGLWMIVGALLAPSAAQALDYVADDLTCVRPTYIGYPAGSAVSAACSATASTFLLQPLAAEVRLVAYDVTPSTFIVGPLGFPIPVPGVLLEASSRRLSAMTFTLATNTQNVVVPLNDKDLDGVPMTPWLIDQFGRTRQLRLRLVVNTKGLVATPGTEANDTRDDDATFQIVPLTGQVSFGGVTTDLVRGNIVPSTSCPVPYQLTANATLRWRPSPSKPAAWPVK